MKTPELLKRMFPLLSGGASSAAQTPSGLEVWLKLSEELPNATGVTEKDKERLNKFKKLLSQKSKEEKLALRSWLKKELKDMETNFDELDSFPEEENERRIKQIYREHLELID